MRILKIAVFLFAPFMLSSQVDMEVAVMAGGTNYFGELTEDFTNLEETQLGFGLLGRLNLHPYINLESHILHSKLSGDDRYNKTFYVRNLSFEGDLTEMALSLEINLLAPKKIRQGKQLSMQRIVPYFSGGVVYTLFGAEVADDLANEDFLVEPFPEANDEATFIALLGGGGLKFYFPRADYFRLDVQGGLRYVLSDYLDGISVNGQPTSNDWYIFAGINLLYRIPVEGSNCFKF